LGWLQERFGPERDISSIQKRELATFRDDLARLDVTQRGRRAPFEGRLTNKAADQIRSVTALRYWRSVQAFFAWAVSEGFVDADPSSGLLMQARKGETKRSPKPFSQAELREFCKTPLYSGYRSPKHVLEKGTCHRRTGRWWSAVVMMFTGLRAGELSQLLALDFDFAADCSPSAPMAQI
jgi:integrase